MPKLAGYKVGRVDYSAVRVVVEQVGYTGPVQLLSMFLCFLGTVKKRSTHYPEENVEEFCKYRKAYKQEHGQNPVFQDVVRQVMSKH